MTASNSLTWRNFEESIMVSGEQRTHRFESSGIEVYFDGHASRIGALLPVPLGAQLPAALVASASLQVRLLSDRSPPQVEMTTSEKSMFRHFFYFASAVSERMELGGTSSLEAAVLELASFAELVETTGALSVERQIGLAGELMFLEHLIRDHGPPAALSWVGPSGEPHDFRIGNSEFEAKATVKSRREHRINGLDQLVPSDGCDLRIVSILLGPGGAEGGVTLPGLVERVRAQLRSDSEAAGHFEAQLSLAQYMASDAPRYVRTYALRRPIALIGVDGGIPAITRGFLKSAFGERARLIEDVTYELDLEGLEREEITI
jgi:hypothetical protein